MGPELFLFLLACAAVPIAPGHCGGTKKSDGEEKSRLPEFLTELDLASLEASQEDVDALKKVVKRLAPKKNGEYQVYQGVMGQPGVDFPVLTTIPATTFSCRGVKGGYYADLETNCQVFHICDNGRKISFLCPNGTVFQQSQLICDWWFKVDCGKSVELYEQSAEQLAQEERKRAEAKKMSSEFHRSASIESDNSQTYYQDKNQEYDGKQNGRMNPFGQSPAQNQLQDNQQTSKSNSFNQNQQAYSQPSNGRLGNTSGQSNEDYSQTSSQQQQQLQQSNFNTYQSVNRQQNQITDNRSRKSSQFNSNYNQRGVDRLLSNGQGIQDYSGSNQQTERQTSRNSKSRNNLNGQVQKVTPSYTETTTFRTSTASPPPKEYQQPAESAAFASNRGNRFNKAFSSNQFNSFYQNRIASTDFQDTTTQNPGRDKFGQSSTWNRPSGIPAFPFPTFAPIYKPRTAATSAAIQSVTSTQKPYENVDYRGQSQPTQTAYSNPDSSTILPFTDNQELQSVTETSNSYGSPENPYQQYTTTAASYNTGYSAFSSQDSSNPSTTQRSYVNTEMYRQNTATQAPSEVQSYENSGQYDSRNTVTPRGGHEVGTDSFSTTTPRPYVNTETYRQNTATAAAITEILGQGTYDRNVATEATPAYVENASGQSGTASTGTPLEVEGAYQKAYDAPSFSTKSGTSGTSEWQDYRQNSISPSTEKPFRGSQSYQNDIIATARTLSPYDMSFTYRQGKVVSTLGPYVPFTKNYLYSVATTSTTTTQKPPIYTATVPTYRTTAQNFVSRVKGGSLSSSRKDGSLVTSSSLSAASRGGATYLPKKTTTESPRTTSATRTSFQTRPSIEKEHAFSMLHSLQDLENEDVPTQNDQGNQNNRPGLVIPPSSGPSTLHSLALYFATASDGFESNETRTDTAIEIDSRGGNEDSSTSAELPASILTQHTVSSYAELFNLNNALESNTTTENRFGSDSEEEENDGNDLEIQQSKGPISGIKKSREPKLRELAQVFTHALSAYLEDPDTFRKVLTEIRPTEPPSTIGTDALEDGTTPYSTAFEDYASVTKEKDEVLDFSDVTNSRKGRPTTPYPTTTVPTSSATQESVFETSYRNDKEFYTTSVTASVSQYPLSNTLTPDESLNEAQSTNFAAPSQQTGSNFAFEVNHAFGTGQSNDIRNYNTGPSGPRDVGDPSAINGPTGSSNDFDSYFPTGSSSHESRYGGFQNNSRQNYSPYGKDVKPFDATPISDNYVASSTPATYNVQYNENVRVLKNKPNSNPVPPQFRDYNRSAVNTVTAGSFRPKDLNNLATNSKLDRIKESVSSTRKPFRITYYDTTDLQNDAESLVTAGSLHSTYRNKYDGVEETQTLGPFTTEASVTTGSEGALSSTMQASGSTIRFNHQAVTNDHWTSSPTVTKLWETTVFVDPKQINYGLTEDPQVTQSTTFESTLDHGTTPTPLREEFLVTDASSGITSQNQGTAPPTPWQWAPNNNDSPTAFTLLPSVYNTESTATPNPTFTTHSITTTITSSVTSSTNNSPHFENLPPSALPLKIDAFNFTENEIVKAQEMFGGLNVTSSNTLLRVMKQADNDTTVRQLVLLLINHCSGPMNKTKEEEKEHLLNALLNMPVNKFDTEESRDIVTSINRLKVSNAEPTERKRVSRPSSAFPTAPPVTTFRSRSGRKFKSTSTTTTSTTTENTYVLSRRADESDPAESDNSLTEEASASDSRALDLLRSLYTIAAKWG